VLRNVRVREKGRTLTVPSTMRELEVIATASDEVRLGTLVSEILVHAFGCGYKGMPRARNLALTSPITSSSALSVFVAWVRRNS
jgi:hypothetical protein